MTFLQSEYDANFSTADSASVQSNPLRQLNPRDKSHENEIEDQDADLDFPQFLYYIYITIPRNFFFSTHDETKDSLHRPKVDVPDLHLVDTRDKNLWAAWFSEQLHELKKNILFVRRDELQKTLMNFLLSIGPDALSPYHFHVLMTKLAHSFVKKAEKFVQDYEEQIEKNGHDEKIRKLFITKRDIIQNTNMNFKRLLGHTQFVEHCLQGELNQVEAILQGKKMLMFGDDLLQPIFFFKKYVSPLIYLHTLLKVNKMLGAYQTNVRFYEGFYTTLKDQLEPELAKAKIIIQSGPLQLPFMWRKENQPKKILAPKTAITETTTRNVIKEILSFIRDSPGKALLKYLLFTSYFMPTLVAANQVVSSASSQKTNTRSKRFTDTAPFQVSTSRGSSPTVVAYGQNTFLDFWIDQASSTGVGMIVNNSGTLLSSIPMTGQMVSYTAAVSTSPLAPQINNPIVMGWSQQVSLGNYTLFAATIDQGIISSPVALLYNLITPSFSLSTLSPLGSFLAAVEVNDGSGSGIQVGSFNKTLGLNWKGLVNTKTSGNQKFPAIDIYDRNVDDRSVSAYVVWVDEVLSGTGYGYLKGTAMLNVFTGSSLPRTNEVDLYTSEYSTLPTLRTMLSDIYLAWYSNSQVTNFNFAYAAKLSSFGSIDQSSINTLGRTSTTNGGPPVILFNSGTSGEYWSVAWQVCSASGATINANFFGRFSFRTVGTTIGTSNYCGVIAAAASADYSNVMLSWSDQISGSPYIFAVVVPIKIRVSNLNTVNTFVRNTQLIMNYPLNLIMPPYLDDANILYNFATNNLGNYSLLEPSGVRILRGSVPGGLQQIFQGNASELNAAYDVGLAYNPPQDFCSGLSVGMQVVDVDYILPFLEGIWTMNCEATASITTALFTTTQAAVTATTASSVTSTLVAATTAAAVAATTNALTAGTFTTSIAEATATTTVAATANALTAGSFTTTIAAVTATTATAASDTTTQAAIAGSTAAAVTGSLAAVAGTTTQVATTNQATAGGFTTSVVVALASTTNAASTTTQAATSNLASATSVATTVAAVTASATSAAASTTRGATTSRAATTALSTSLAATSGNSTSGGAPISNGGIAGLTVGGVLGVAIIGASGFFGWRYHQNRKTNKAIENARTSTKPRMLANAIIKELSLTGFDNFDDESNGAQFATIIGGIAIHLREPQDGNTIVSIEERTPEQIEGLAAIIAECIKYHVNLEPASDSTLQRLISSNDYTLDLNKLSNKQMDIASGVLEILRQKESTILTARLSP